MRPFLKHEFSLINSSVQSSKKIFLDSYSSQIEVQNIPSLLRRHSDLSLRLDGPVEEARSLDQKLKL